MWSTDWWHDAGAALDRFDAALRCVLERSRTAYANRAALLEASTAAIAPVPDDCVSPVAVEQPIADEDGRLDPAGDYARTSFADCADRIDPAQFNEPGYIAMRREMIGRLMAAEALIGDDRLVERIVRARGLRRSGA